MGRRHGQQKMAGKKHFQSTEKKKKGPRRQRHLATDARNKRHVQRHAADYTKCFAHKFQNNEEAMFQCEKFDGEIPADGNPSTGNLIDFVAKCEALVGDGSRKGDTDARGRLSLAPKSQSNISVSF
jgi:hypothetical protein